MYIIDPDSLNRVIILSKRNIYIRTIYKTFQKAGSSKSKSKSKSSIESSSKKVNELIKK